MNIKKLFLLASLIIACTVCPAQSKKSVSILGDSYSTFQGYLQPDTNYVWYNAGKHDNTDVTAVQQTWWHRLISSVSMDKPSNSPMPIVSIPARI